jgi:2',3'-cyclic-nucleotide 2'-phosphodiesterase (5'-nucleotidase family)
MKTVNALKQSWLLLLALLLLSACQDPSVELLETPVETAGQENQEVETTEPSESQMVRITILYTNDEHGWMEGQEEGQGAAEMMDLWRKEENYSEEGPFLILSGGDSWTGPAVSTWFDGESMVEVMNAMGYDAAAIGNHEFDFGLDGLRERSAQAEFPLLSANIREKESGEIADIALPYVVQDVGGLQVGLIGLTTLSAPETTNPEAVAPFDFIPYPEALAEVVPEAKADGAELLVVVGHICGDDREWIASSSADLGITVIGGGHCHQKATVVEEDVALIESGSYLRGYVRVDISYDKTSETVTELTAQYRSNSGGSPDPEVAAIINRWRAEADETLTEVIGYLEEPLVQRSNAMINLVLNAWLAAYPAADIAMTNTGGFRQTIAAGDVTLETVIGVLPFNNVLVDVELTGAEIIRNIECCRPVAAGMSTVGKYTLSDGRELEKEATYHVLVNDFMYAGGDGFVFQEQDPDAYNTSIDWRQPVIDWIVALKTSPEDPLDNYLDPENRQW